MQQTESGQQYSAKNLVSLKFTYTVQYKYYPADKVGIEKKVNRATFLSKENLKKLLPSWMNEWVVLATMLAK